jgi:uncharacterized membrane protein
MHIRLVHLALVLLPAEVAFTAQLESLGAMPGGSFSPHLVSADGAVISGWSMDPIHGTKVGVWTRASDLVLLDQGSPDSFSAGAMSADGSILAGDQLDVPPLAARRPMLWDRAAGTRTPLGLLPGCDTGSVIDVSADGSTVIGGCGEWNGFRSQIFRWTATGGLQPLVSPGAIFSTYRRCISSDGTVVVGDRRSALFSGDRRATIWSASGGFSSVPGLPDAVSYVAGVSDDGLHLVGSIAHSAFPSGLFYYQPGLGAFPVDLGGGSANTGSSILISADGSTVVAQVSGRVVKWSLGGGPRVLAHPGYAAATSVSADGAVVTGYIGSSFGTADLRPFRWEDSEPVELLEGSVPGLAAVGAMVSRDGSTICGRSTVDPSLGQIHGARWHASGTIGEGYCGPAAPNSIGVSAALELSGSNVISRGGLVLHATGLPAGALGYFLVSPSSALVGGIPGTQGTLCLGAPIGRFVGPGQVQQATLFNTMVLVVDPRELPGPSGPFSATRGERLYFQAWYRDVTPGGSSNFTSGAVVRFL